MIWYIIYENNHKKNIWKADIAYTFLYALLHSTLQIFEMMTVAKYLNNIR